MHQKQGTECELGPCIPESVQMGLIGCNRLRTEYANDAENG